MRGGCAPHCHRGENRPQFAGLRSHPSAMPHPQQNQSQAFRPRLYLVTPAIDDAAGFARELAAALNAADVAAVLVRLAESDERAKINKIKALGPTIQDKGAAL